MPESKQPENQPDQNDALNAPPPDVSLPESHDEKDKLKAEYDAKIAEYEKKLAAEQKEKESFAQQIKDAQRKMHEATERAAEVERYVEAVKSEPQSSNQQVSFDDYEKELVGIFEEDPVAGAKKMARDFAMDRERDRAMFAQMIKEAEEKAYSRAIQESPWYQERVKAFEKIAEQSPELKDLPEKQKLAVINLLSKNQPDKQDNATGNEPPSENGDLSKIGGGPKTPPQEKDWVDDPETARVAKQLGFQSKKEIREWYNKVR